MLAISYQPDKCKMSYGLYKCQKCNSEFYGGGIAIHKHTCDSVGYKDTCYCFGDNETWKLCLDIPIPSKKIIDVAINAPYQVIEL